MFPTLLKLGPITIHSYGLMLAVGVVICSFLLSRDAKRFNLNADMVFDLVFWAVVGGIVGARLFFILLNISFFIQNPLEIIMIQNGGLSFQGGLIVGSLASVWFVRRKKLPLLLVLDLAAPYLALGQSVGRVGCFLNGCCYGREVPWGIYFPVHDAHLHPTQLYSTTGLLIIFGILKMYQKQVLTPSSAQPASGRVFILYLMLAATFRFGVEFFRADHNTLFLGLSVFQYVCLGLILTALVISKKIQR